MKCVERGATVKIGIRLPAAGSLQQIVGTAQDAESVGVDMVWMPDSQLNYREVWTTLGAIAVSTSRINIGPMVTNFASRHLTVTAGAARTVAEAAPGRFTLGMGAGDSAIGFDGMKHAKIAEMESGLHKIRSLLAGKPTRFGDFDAHLRDAGHAAPILLAASGPKALALASQIADGVVITQGRTAMKLADVKTSAAVAGRAAPPVYILSTLNVTDDPSPLMPVLKIGVARIAQLEGVGVLEEAGFEISGDFLSHRTGAQNDIGHSADVAEAGKAFDAVISDDMALWYMQERTFWGSREQVLAKIEKVAALGVAGIYVAQPQSSVLPAILIEQLADLLPACPGR